MHTFKCINVNTTFYIVPILIFKILTTPFDTLFEFIESKNPEKSDNIDHFIEIIKGLG